MIGRRIAADGGGAGALGGFGRPGDRRYRRVAFDVTLQYRKAMGEQGVDYDSLKCMARNSIAYSFADASSNSRLQAELEAAFCEFAGRTANGSRRAAS